MSFDKPIAANKYISVDQILINNNVELTNDNIVASIQPLETKDEYDSDGEELPSVLPIKVLESLEHVLIFLRNPPNDFKIKEKSVSMVNSLK